MIKRTVPWFPALFSLPMLVVGGCREPEAPAPAAPAATSPVDTATEQPAQSAGDEEDTWMACYINGSKVGYTHLASKVVDKDGERLREYTYNDELSVKRFNQTTVVTTRLSSTETISGRLLAFRCEPKTGPESVVTVGTCDGDELTIVTDPQGRKDTMSIPWKSSWGGFFADQRSLRDEPLEPGDARTITALFPLLNEPVEIQMEAAAIEAVRLPAGVKQLLRIEVTAHLKQMPFKSILWADDTGTVWKSKDLLLGMEALFVDRQQALSPSDAAGFDLGSDIVIHVQRTLDRPHETRRVVYEATLPEDDASTLFTAGASQQIQPVDTDTVKVTVFAVRPEDPPEVEKGVEAAPTAADKQGGAMIQSDDSKIVAMAEKAAGDESDPWTVACRLEKYVKGAIHLKNYSTAMATAAEVAESLEGDCTEHAVLLAALCRAREIPARVAIGLLYYPAESGFAYHMWTEVWIHNRWIPMDATLGRGGIGAAHLKFTHSSLQTTAAYAELLPVVRAIGRLELEILEVE